ncbi:MAG: hypothetical protein AAGI24_04140 [Pseudomonadota bacterium]
MWIFTTYGFISAVEHRNQPGRVLVRARKREHLEALFPGQTITQKNGADYKYRIEVTKSRLASVLQNQVMQHLTYTNFKNSIADHEYHDACMRVWAAMRRLQDGSQLNRFGADDLDGALFDDDIDPQLMLPGDLGDDICPECGGDFAPIQVQGGCDLNVCTSCGFQAPRHPPHDDLWDGSDGRIPF